ncbi:MAG: energy-coupling factor transporter transmembrane component T family protein [Pleomorphochaeta sp.]
MSSATIYSEGRGFLYKVDPRAKVIATIIACVFVFLPIFFSGLVTFSILLVVLSFYSVGLKNTNSVIKAILPMIILVIIFAPLYEREGTPLLYFKGSPLLTYEGLFRSLSLTLRFFSITFACSLLFLTTKMNDFILALQAFFIPYKSCLTISLVFRTIPTIFDAFNQISDSHSLRRSSDNKKRKLKNLFPTLTSALVVSLKTIPSLAMSLEARGYGLKTKRTNYHELTNNRYFFIQTVAILSIYVLLLLKFKNF